MNLRYCIKEFVLKKGRGGRDLLRGGSLPEDLDLLDAGLFDSLGFLELLEALEQRFRIEIDLENHEPSSFIRLDGLVDIVETNAALQVA